MEVQEATGLTEAERRLTEARRKVVAEKSRHEIALSNLGREVAAATERRDMVLVGISLGRLEVAETVLEIMGPKNWSVGDGPTVVRKAIRDLADGAVELRSSYMGTKNYDRFRGQEAGASYGYGPKHGSTIFSIGLTPPFRQRWDETERKHVADRELTAEETDAAIAYLHALMRRSS